MTTNVPTSTNATDMARDEVSRVAGTATEKAGDVAQTAVEQAKEVASEAAAQARNLATEVRSQVDEQSAAQLDRLVETLRSVGNELDQMVGSSGQSGMASDLVRQAAERVHGAVRYLESRRPADLVTDLTNLARRRPGAFLVGAAVAGMVAGRLTRGARAASASESQQSLMELDPHQHANGVSAGRASAGTTPLASPGAEHISPASELAWSTSSGNLAPYSLDDPSTREAPTLTAGSEFGDGGRR